MLSLTNLYNAELLIDEAHSFGVFGQNGRGLVNQLNLDGLVQFTTATMSKSLGAYGGVVFCSSAIKKLLINKSKSFVYNTSLPPSILNSGLAAINLLKTNENLGDNLLRKSQKLRSCLQDSGLNTLYSKSQIIPVLIGDAEVAKRVEMKLRSKGIIAMAIRHPTVPLNTARIRLSVSLGHTDEQLDFVAKEIISVAKEEKIV